MNEYKIIKLIENYEENDNIPSTNKNYINGYYKTQSKFYINNNIKQKKLIKKQYISVSLESKRKYYFK